WRAGAFVFIGLGWLVSAYLLLQTWGTIPFPNSALVCFGCRQALTGSARQLGFPIAGWGMVYFAAVGFLLAIGGPAITGAALVVAAGGLGASFVFATALLLGGAPVCPQYMLVNAANLALFLSLWCCNKRALVS